MAYKEGIQMGMEGPMMTGWWMNPRTGDKFEVRDCFFQDSEFRVQTMDGRVLDYNTIQEYIQFNDKQGKPTQPDMSLAQNNNELPPEVANLVSEDVQDLLTPEDNAISRGLGNINSQRSINPTGHAQPQTQQAQMLTPEQQDAAMIDRVLRRFELPQFVSELVWQMPERQIETLIDMLGIDPEAIAQYYINKLDKDAIFDHIKQTLVQYLHNHFINKQLVTDPMTEMISEIISEPPTKTSKTVRKGGVKKETKKKLNKK